MHAETAIKKNCFSTLAKRFEIPTKQNFSFKKTASTRLQSVEMLLQ